MTLVYLDIHGKTSRLRSDRSDQAERIQVQVYDARQAGACAGRRRCARDRIADCCRHAT